MAKAATGPVAISAGIVGLDPPGRDARSSERKRAVIMKPFR
jgi:hypothetical protein